MATNGRGATLTILDTTTTSNAINLFERSLVALQMPAAFTGTSLTFESCVTEGGTYLQVTKGSDGLAYTVTVAASKYVTIPVADLVGISFLKVVSSGAEAADRIIIPILRSVS